jgi:hypothetical protein
VLPARSAVSVSMPLSVPPVNDVIAVPLQVTLSPLFATVPRMSSRSLPAAPAVGRPRGLACGLHRSHPVRAHFRPQTALRTVRHLKGEHNRGNSSAKRPVEPTARAGEIEKALSPRRRQLLIFCKVFFGCPTELAPARARTLST